MASGVGYYYGDANTDDLLAGLLADGYDYPQAYVDACLFVPNSPVAELPATLIDLHLSSLSDMPFGFDPHWDADGNWIP